MAKIKGAPICPSEILTQDSNRSLSRPELLGGQMPTADICFRMLTDDLYINEVDRSILIEICRKDLQL